MIEPTKIHFKHLICIVCLMKEILLSKILHLATMSTFLTNFGSTTIFRRSVLFYNNLFTIQGILNWKKHVGFLVQIGKGFKEFYKHFNGTYIFLSEVIIVNIRKAFFNSQIIWPYVGSHYDRYFFFDQVNTYIKILYYWSMWHV